MPTAGTSGALAFLAVGTAASPTTALNFQNCSLKRTRTIFDPNNIRGTRSHQSEQTRFGNSTVGGQINLIPSKAEWLALLPWILSDARNGAATSPFALGDVPITRYVQLDTVTKVFTYVGCVVNRATIRGSVGGPVSLALDVIGLTENMTNSGTGSGTGLGTGSPLMFADGVFTLPGGGSAYRLKDFTITIDNAITPVWNNSADATYVIANDRTISVAHNNPWTADEVGLYNLALTGSNGATFNFTNGSDNLLFTFGTIQYPAETPVVPGKSELPLVMNGIARKLTTTEALVVTCT